MYTSIHQNNYPDPLPFPLYQGKIPSPSVLWPPISTKCSGFRFLPLLVRKPNLVFYISSYTYNYYLTLSSRTTVVTLGCPNNTCKHSVRPSSAAK